MNNVSLLNLTPHPITIRTTDGSDVTVPPSGIVARVESEEYETGNLFPEIGASVPVVTRRFGRVVDLPERDDYHYYIVSSLVLEALRNAGEDRPDVFAPDTGPSAIRDGDGRVVAVTRLICL